MPLSTADLLRKKISEVVQHVGPLPQAAEYPLAHYKRSATDAWNLRDYVHRKIKGASFYKKVVDAHMSALHRMVLVSVIEAFERFLKETAAVCVEHLAKCVLDDRFDVFPVKGSLLAAHFGADSLGKSLCESGTWLDCDSINKRFRTLLGDAFDEKKGDFYVFPKKGQEPSNERFRHGIICVIWQLRHTIVHNVGVITQSDAVKFQLLVRQHVGPQCLLEPTRDDVRYVKRFLDETAERVNERVGRRLAELLTTLYAEDPNLFQPQDEAGLLANEFGMKVSVAGATGTP